MNQDQRHWRRKESWLELDAKAVAAREKVATLSYSSRLPLAYRVLGRFGCCHRFSQFRLGRWAPVLSVNSESCHVLSLYREIASFDRLNRTLVESNIEINYTLSSIYRIQLSPVPAGREIEVWAILGLDLVAAVESEDFGASCFGQLNREIRKREVFRAA